MVIGSADAACLVADRTHVGQAVTLADELGGGWARSAQLWARLDYSYLVMLAHERLRLERAAPLVVMARDAATLEATIEHACSLLDNVRCAWITMLDEGALALVRRVTLADAVAAGRA